MPTSIHGTNGITFNDGSTQNTRPAVGFRNRIINGDMRIDQRNAGASKLIDGTSSYFIDRFFAEDATDGAFTTQRSTIAPSGYSNSMAITTSTADASLTAFQAAYIQQKIEGFNISDLGWGTASAKTVTLSFWVRSSLTGTFGGALRNGFQGSAWRSYPFSYSITLADTWEQKTITVAGDTSGTWGTDNGVGIEIFFGLGVGSGYSGTAGAWSSSNNISATGAVSVVGTLNATWYLTGVQLEAGLTATEFERRPIGTELALCQRYCPAYIYSSSASAMETIGFVRGGSSASVGNGQFSFPVTTRVPATGLQVTGTYAVSGVAFTTVAFNGSSTQTASISLSGGSGLSNSSVYELQSSVAGNKLIWTGCEL